MKPNRLIIPVAIAAVGASAAIAGIMRADAAETAACAVTYAVPNQWNTGFTGAIQVKNTGGTPVSGWTLAFAFAAGQQLAGGWNGVWKQSGTAVSVADAGWNSSIASGSTVTLGFNGSWRGSNPAPVSFTLNGVVCSGSAAASASASPSSTASPSVSTSPPASRAVTPSASASASPTKATSTSASTPAGAAQDCTPGAAITAGKYWISNNQWGKDGGSGSLCVWQTSRSGDNLAWGTDWGWTGASDQVKTFASTVLGWHWGTKIAGTGLPVRLSDHKAVTTTWNFTVTQQTANTLDVSYDLWLHNIGNADWNNQPTDEVMVWLYRSGGAGPVGTKQATVTIGGTTWDLYQGNIGWNVFSFVRTSNTTSATLNLTDFTDTLVGRGVLQNTKYLSSVESGAEIFTGQGRLDTSAYAVTVG